MESESCVGLTIMLLLVLGMVFVLILDEFKMK